LITGQDGHEVGRLFYSPYGSIISRTGTFPTDRLFTGQRWESGLDLYDYRARFYDPLLGRFVSPDTIVPEPGNPQDWNRYSYVTNNPLKFVDPDGHCRGLTGAAWSACAEIVMAVAPAVHQANEYREDIFFPDADTTFADRLEASSVVGGGAVLAAAATIETVGLALGGGALTTAALNNAAAATAGGATAATVCGDGDCTNEAQATGRVFWSGGDLAREAAQAWARANNHVTLEMTKMGKRVEQATRGLNWREVIPKWKAASREFAAGAEGEIHVFHSSKGVSLESVWGTVENQILLNSPKVTRIIYHVIMPDGSEILVP
jgi:RHS repeat-associated protein